MQLFHYASQRHEETGIADKHIIARPTIENGVKQIRLKKRIFLLHVGEMTNVQIRYKEKHDSPWKRKKVECKVVGVKFTECSVEYGAYKQTIVMTTNAACQNSCISSALYISQPSAPVSTFNPIESRPHVENYVSRCTASKYGGEPQPCFLGPRDPVSGLHDVFYDTPIPIWYKAKVPSPPIHDAEYAYVCGQGARVAVRTQPDSVLRSGTVVGLVADTTSAYTIRFDNSTATTNINLCISNATPESTYSYDPGQRLMLLVTALTDWVDVVVVSYQGKEFGSRHVVQPKSGTQMEVDLNRFNHTIQTLKSAEHFFELRASFREHLRQRGRRVADFITGREVEVSEQNFNFELLQAGPGIDADTPNNLISINGLAKELAHVTWNRSQGEFSTRPMLLLAGAGAGKTWAAHKVVCAGKR